MYEDIVNLHGRRHIVAAARLQLVTEVNSVFELSWFHLCEKCVEICNALGRHGDLFYNTVPKWLACLCVGGNLRSSCLTPFVRVTASLCRFCAHFQVSCSRFFKFSFSLKFFHQFPDFLTPKLFLWYNFQSEWDYDLHSASFNLFTLNCCLQWCHCSCTDGSRPI